jgi:hypothetical protein
MSPSLPLSLSPSLPLSLSPSLPLSLSPYILTYTHMPTNPHTSKCCSDSVAEQCREKSNVVQTLISSKSKSNNQMLFELILTEAKSNFHNYVSKFRKVLKVIHPFFKIFIIHKIAFQTPLQIGSFGFVYGTN